MAIDQKLFNQRLEGRLQSRRHSDLKRTLPSKVRVDLNYPKGYSLFEVGRMVREKFYSDVDVLEFITAFRNSIPSHMMNGNFSTANDMYLKKKSPRSNKRWRKVPEANEDAPLVEWPRSLKDHNGVRDKLCDLGAALLRESATECWHMPKIHSIRLDVAWYDPNNNSRISHAFEVHHNNWDGWKPAVANLLITRFNHPDSHLFLVMINQDHIREVNRALGSKHHRHHPYIEVLSIANIQQVVANVWEDPQRFKEVFRV